MDAFIDGVKVANTPSGTVPVVLVGVEDDDDLLPVFVGFDEAMAIRRGLDAEDIGRPLTHDLLLDVMEELGGRVERVEITELREGTYIADLHLDTPREATVVDARPSDALALAARTNAPISVAREVYEAGKELPDEFEELYDIREVVTDE
ncbi:bifunctional nuclease family protein [Halosegnis marinus]|uniref:Bifunctional nuclease family protein n=1 Tax=Halosegnis marinus TaxID=3034023 RepID=A0ABD5ZMJ1_9EURY|nr:bifunctional nuclease family protein [Halosegnis sp. DT85]